MRNSFFPYRSVYVMIVLSTLLLSCDNKDILTDTYNIQYVGSAVLVRINDATFTMVRVEGGTFEMGATEEQGTVDPYEKEYPVHTVNLGSFYICQTEVTQAVWKAVMRSNPSLILGDDRLPVDCVKWDMCQEFITKLNEILEYKLQFRMPTEAEWEFAARGGNQSHGYKYAGSNNVGEVAWYESNSDGQTHPVGLKKPNELGLYDMSGNIWEWCHDWEGHYSPDEQTNPTGPDKGTHRIMRGGSWTYDYTFCRVSNRNYISHVIRASNCGLRLAMTCDNVATAE